VDAQELPYADGCFDAVIANHMPFHVADRPTASVIRRVLAAVGRVYATTVGEPHMEELRVRKKAGHFGARKP